MLKRPFELKSLQELLRKNPVVGVVGARQVGKTTLTRMLIRSWKTPVSFFDLENPENLLSLSEPMFVLKKLKGLVVIDEIQRHPELFPVLRVLVDRPRNPARFLILGSASPNLLRQSSETLAGRISYHELNGFAVDEVDRRKWDQLWVRGGFPLSFLAKTNHDSFNWRLSYIRNFLERDLPQLGITIQANTMRRFWTMLAHYHGQKWNASEIGRSFGVADTTVRNYLDILTSALVVRQLLPWYENVGKRQVKAPKIYIQDAGILHTLLNLRTLRDLECHPKLGASWEGFVIGQVIRRLGALPEECFYWATHSGAELDLLVVRGRLRIGFEVKRTSAPRVTPSMQNAIKDLGLKTLAIIHVGESSYSLAKNVKAVAFLDILKSIAPL